MERFKKKTAVAGLSGILTFLGWQTGQGVYSDRIEPCYEIGNSDERKECLQEQSNFESNINLLGVVGVGVTFIYLKKAYDEADRQITSKNIVE